MKNIILSGAAILILCCGICIGYFMRGKDINPSSPLTGVRKASRSDREQTALLWGLTNRSELCENHGQSPRDREPAPYLIRGGGEVKGEKDKGEGVKDRKPAPYPRDISSKKNLSKLPVDIAPLKELASRKDPESVRKTIDIHRKGEISARTVIEMQARDNPVLKAGLSREIAETLSSGDSRKKALAIQSAIRLKQFDEPYRGKIRQLIKDKDPEVASRALSFCGWARDTDAFETVLGVLKGPDSGKVEVKGLTCISVIGRGRESEISPVIAEKLASKSPNVRRACLAVLFHLNGCLKHSEVKARVAEISVNDSFSVKTGKGERYPLRDLAKELLKLHESK